jgi:hypothetical protein
VGEQAALNVLRSPDMVTACSAAPSPMAGLWANPSAGMMSPMHMPPSSMMSPYLYGPMPPFPHEFPHPPGGAPPPAIAVAAAAAAPPAVAAGAAAVPGVAGVVRVRVVRIDVMLILKLLAVLMVLNQVRLSNPLEAVCMFSRVGRPAAFVSFRVELGSEPGRLCLMMCAACERRWRPKCLISLCNIHTRNVLQRPFLSVDATRTYVVRVRTK